MRGACVTCSGSWTYHVSELQFGSVFLVVPVSVVQPLSEQLNGWLGTVLLFGWHVQVIHKHHCFLTHGRTVNTFTPPEGGRDGKEGWEKGKEGEGERERGEGEEGSYQRESTCKWLPVQF